MDINFIAVFTASILQFILGAVWYSPIMFGKLWMKIHNCDNLSKAELEKMQKEMGPYYGVQFVITVITTIALAHLIQALPQYSPYMLAFWMWIGFIVPTQVSAIIFGSDPKKWVPQKIAIIAGSSIVCLLIAATVISLF